ncbi:hypothetical protein C8J57DRAFT_1255087 [Mycena rebaudengoi]|nr:hypothetical protein C8J57DRAFT_1255087 [Mycena rebaudengoi]
MPSTHASPSVRHLPARVRGGGRVGVVSAELFGSSQAVLGCSGGAGSAVGGSTYVQLRVARFGGGKGQGIVFQCGGRVYVAEFWRRSAKRPNSGHTADYCHFWNLIFEGNHFWWRHGANVEPSESEEIIF